MGNAIVNIAIANVFFLQVNPLKSKGYKYSVLDCKEGDRVLSALHKPLSWRRTQIESSADADVVVLAITYNTVLADRQRYRQ